MTSINARRVLRSRAALAVFLILPLVLLHLGMSGRPALPSMPALADIKFPRPWATSSQDHDPDTQAELDALHNTDSDDAEVELAAPHTTGGSGSDHEGGAANHTYLPNGLLVPNPEAQHPIYDLVERAKEKWRRKQEGQSTTLREAVDEYRRRYGRAPPKGFDNWFKWAKENGVKLLDEYDQIVSFVCANNMGAGLVRARCTMSCPAGEAAATASRCPLQWLAVTGVHEAPVQSISSVPLRGRANRSANLGKPLVQNSPRTG